MAKLKISEAAREKMKSSGNPYTLYLSCRGGWGGSIVTPAVQAGEPALEEEYHKKEVDGITFYIRNQMMDKAYSINWTGIWIFGAFVVRELS